jgi:phosphonate dehydrogenase
MIAPVSERPRIVVTHRVAPEVLRLLRRRGSVSPNQTADSRPREEILRRASSARALLCFMPDRVDEAFLSQCPRLGIVSGAFKGADNVDLDACSRRGIWVTNVPDLLTEPTAELAVLLLLALARRLLEGDRLVRGGTFRGWRPILLGAGIAMREIGVVGMGVVGQAIARRLHALGATVSYSDPRALAPGLERKLGVHRLPLERLLARSDGIVLAAPLTPRSLHLINRRTLRSMRPGALLVNIGRGSVVEEEAVADALKSGRLGGYGADVFEMEDLSRPDRPRAVSAGLLGNRDRTVFTPHLGSAVEDVRREIATTAAWSILDYLSSREPRHALNRPTRGKP